MLTTVRNSRKLDLNHDGKIHRRNEVACTSNMVEKCDVNHDTRFDEVDINMTERAKTRRDRDAHAIQVLRRD